MWTRIENNKKSVIDYVLINESCIDSAEEVTIDENKLITPFRIAENKLTYTDHCAIITKIGWYQANSQTKQEERMIISSVGMKKFKQKTEVGQLTRIASTCKDLKDKYNEWQLALQEIIEQSFKTKKRRRESKLKSVRILMKAKRKIRHEMLSEDDSSKKRVKRIQEKLIDEHILHESKKERCMKIEKMVDRIKGHGGLNSGAFWEFKKGMDTKKRKDAPSTIRSKEGKVLEDKDEILDAYAEFYKQLLSQSVPEEGIGEVAEEVRGTIFSISQFLAQTKSDEDQRITTSQVENNIKKLKNKKSLDPQGMSNLLLKEGGSDLIASLCMVFNSICEENTVPEQWKVTTIVSIYKNKGSKTDLNNRRGLFITNVVSKLFEKILLGKNDNQFKQSISKFQCGGVKGKSTADQVMALNAIIEYNGSIGSETYVLFGDAYKCFDKLDLKDCINDLSKIIGHRDAQLVYEMNRNGSAKVKTPHGVTKDILLNEVVRQGTIYGPKLCSINTDKVNSIGKKCITTIGPNLKCEALIYVDDIQFATSNKRMLENAISNCRSMETLKKYTFNNQPEKSAILIIKPKAKSTIKDINTEVKWGRIEQVSEYKYLGEWYNSKGNHETSMKKRMEKTDFMSREVRRYGDECIVGNEAIRTRIKLYQTIVVPSIFHNIETWSNISKKEINELESVQGRMLRSICEQSSTTPYWGILAETGIWPIEKIIEYKKIMLCHGIMTSCKNRLLREIVEEQMTRPWKGCWMIQTQEICNTYGLNVVELKKMSKNQLKTDIKRKIKSAIEKELQEQRSKTKLRFCTEFGQKRYLSSLNHKDAILMIKTRLNMLELKGNFKNKYTEGLTCELCDEADDDTEHLFECKYIKRIIKSKSIKIDGEEEQVVRYVKSAMDVKAKLRRS